MFNRAILVLSVWTVLAFAAAGCMTRRTITLDAQNPAVRVSVNGVLFGDTFVKAAEVPEILDDYDVPRERVIHIFLDKDVKDLREARFLMGMLAKAGYTRSVLVTKRHSESMNLGRKKTASPQSSAVVGPKSRKVRYKRAGE